MSGSELLKKNLNEGFSLEISSEDLSTASLSEDHKKLMLQLLQKDNFPV